MAEEDTTKSWGYAKTIAETIGSVPATFATAVRFLHQDVEQNHNEIGRNARSCLSRLLNSPGFLSPLYFCAKTFRSSRVGAPGNSSSAILDSFSADEMSIVVALLYLFRRVRKLSPSDSSDFDIHSRYIHIEADIGAYAGQAIKTIGFSTGLLTGAMRQLAIALFLVVDKAGFAEYKRGLKRRSLSFDYDAERKRWGCTHAQVASICLQLVGLGKAMGDDLALGLTRDNFNVRDPSPGAQAIQVAASWVDSLYREAKPPEMVAARYYPFSEDLDGLLKQAELVSAREPGPSMWLKRGKEDIRAADAPLAAASPSEADEELNKELEEQLGEIKKGGS